MWHSFLFFGEIFVQTICLFFIGLFVILLTFKNYLYILDTSYFLNKNFANIFSWSTAYLFIFLSRENALNSRYFNFGECMCVYSSCFLV